ncbi:XrtA/PEP-CTERM system TPR-repeat protein PrsT [Uliginosibacterium sp. H3]|uniref:XrtA/PEP-CTERM system TPR-repeat protein PrsT n=1 Tax=Uliginosibacterium silvisoli TaxID=3114758 RepID=A0ABU6K946_9RHOO|nr:XrtA/PEP-CTERM system TPR-repeat protein PrsT [Uliginosibacterium sp. H3]
MVEISSLLSVNIRRLACVVLLASLAGVTWAADTAQAGKYYEDGLARFRKNDMDGAVIQLKNALQQDNRLLAAHVLLGRALFRSGNISAAEAAFNDALRLGVNRSEVLALLARVYLLQGQPKMVIERITPDGLPPEAKVEVLSLRGLAFADMGDYPQASRSFEDARAIDPASVVPLLAEIPILLTQRKMDRARFLADRAVALAPTNADAWNMSASVAHATLDLKTALDRYGKALALDPGHVDARIARASLLLGQQRDAEAERDLNELKKLVPKEARYLYLSAVLAGRRGKSDEVRAALVEIAQVVDGLPASWLATREQFLMLGAVAHHGLSSRVKAQAYLEAVLTLNVRNVGARRLLASVLLDKGDYGAVERTLDPVLRDSPNDPQALYLMGQLRLAQKRYVQASQLLDRAAQLGGDSAEIRAAIGFTQLGLGDGGAGLKSLESSFAKKPGDAKVGLALAIQYVRSGQGAKAVAVAEAVAKADPANIAALNALGAVRGAVGDKAGARKAYEQVLAKDPSFAPALLNLAKLDQADGRTDDARKRLTTWLARNGDDDNAMYELAMIELSSGRRAEAQRWLEKAFGQRSTNERAGRTLVDVQLAQGAVQPALKTAIELADANRTSLDAQAALVRAQLAAGERGKAVITLKEMTQMAEYDAVVQIRIGRLQLMADNPDGAAYNAQKSLTAVPNNLAGLALMADAELTRKDFLKAEAISKDIITRYPTSAEGYRIGGDAAVGRGNPAAATQAYRGALERDPSSTNTQRVAHALALAGDLPRAQEVLGGWLKSNPNDLGCRAALAEINMRAGNWKGAREQYDKVLAAQPNAVNILNNQATVLQRLNDPAALGMAERAYKLAPQDPLVIDTYGWGQAQAGKLDAALRLLRDARLRLPENGDIRYHLAWTLARLDRKQEAREELAYALKASGSFESINDARTLMKALGG